MEMATDWVAIGLSRDLPAGTVMAAVWQGVELAVWRSAAGRLSAWKDRCPHRGMRLSHGFVRGETLACIYHGWVYGTDGGCNRIPAHPVLVPPSAIKAEAFSCSEASGVIWVAPANVSGATPDLAGWEALRSMPFNCDAKAFSQGLPGFKTVGPGRFEGSVTVDGAAVRLCLLVQELGLAKRMVHALHDPLDDAVAASRWLEALRLRLEEGVAA
jgi:phenylpropionate dioxygenase-like ring-hydroxylating dioxygenase large terminal subunit